MENCKEITNCRACRNKELRPILSLGKQYLSHFVDDSTDKGEAYPLDLVLCKKCYLLQLKHTVNQNLLYTSDYGYRSSINQTMRDYLQGIAKEAQKRVLLMPGAVIVDVGCNDNFLLKQYEGLMEGVQRVGFDPLVKFAKDVEGTDIIFINDYFNKKAYQEKMSEKKAKIITAISCFYDIDDIPTFLTDIKDILDDDGMFIISQNYMVGMLLQNGFENIVHEHLSFQSLLSLENMLEPYDLEVFHVELNDLNGGSFRTYIAPKGTRKVQDSVSVLREQEKQMKLDTKEPYEAFAERIEIIRNKIHSFVKRLVSEGKTVYCLGASTRGNTLLQFCGLDNSLIRGAGERNSEKFGKYIASVGIPIISEEEMRRVKPDAILVLPWFFFDEIKLREKEYLEKGGKFLIPLPHPIIVSKEGEFEL